MKPSVVIFISNPFGFGPTGKTVALIEELYKVWPGKIVYAASPMCLETLPEYMRKKIQIENIDERNEDSLRLIYKKYDNPLIVCTLNRLAIRTAKSMNLKAIFVDSLAWMWKEIPSEYLMADTYYCFNLFGLKDRIQKRENIKVISPVFGILPRVQTKKESFVLFRIGGFKNPFQDKMSFAYLNLLVDSFSSFKQETKVVVTGGKDAITYMNSRISNNNFSFCTLGRNEFLQHLNKSSHFVTTSGLTATLEAFALRAPTSFIPPTNLSQLNILKLMSDRGCADSRMDWSSIIGSEINFDDLSEIEAVPIFNRVAEKAFNNKTSHDCFVMDLNSLLTNIPDSTKQTDFIKDAGINGSETIVADLLPQFSTL